MVLPPWLRKASFKIPLKRHARNRFLLNAREFRREAIRERIRADRSRMPLAILIIALPADRRSDRDFAFLCKILRRRLRITDTAGYLPDGRVAVLLPDTPNAGAWKVASDVCDNYPPGHERPDCEVFVYPEESRPPAEEPQTRTTQPVELPAATLESLFAHPTPILKRALDIIVATFGLVVLWPLLVFLAALIKVSSPGPVFYSQLREGHGGRRFRMYKFRTMRVDADREQSALRAFNEQDGPAFKMQNDPRTTWIGRLLRRTSLDEMPQLWNVLVGDMSLVGPRPLPTNESLECLPWQRQRLSILPGLTCIWQVKGRNTVTFDEWMRMDLQYLRRRSLLYDLKLLLTTGPSIVLTKGPR